MIKANSGESLWWNWSVMPWYILKDYHAGSGCAVVSVLMCFCGMLAVAVVTLLWVVCMSHSPAAEWLSPLGWRRWCCHSLGCQKCTSSILGWPLCPSLIQTHIPWWSEKKKAWDHVYLNMNKNPLRMSQDSVIQILYLVILVSSVKVFIVNVNPQLTLPWNVKLISKRVYSMLQMQRISCFICRFSFLFYFENRSFCICSCLEFLFWPFCVTCLWLSLLFLPSVPFPLYLCEHCFYL